MGLSDLTTLFLCVTVLMMHPTHNFFAPFGGCCQKGPRAASRPLGLKIGNLDPPRRVLFDGTLTLRNAASIDTNKMSQERGCVNFTAHTILCATCWEGGQWGWIRGWGSSLLVCSKLQDDLIAAAHAFFVRIFFTLFCQEMRLKMFFLPLSKAFFQ